MQRAPCLVRAAVLGLASVCLAAYAAHVAYCTTTLPVFERGAINVLLYMATAVAESPCILRVRVAPFIWVVCLPGWCFSSSLANWAATLAAAAVLANLLSRLLRGQRLYWRGV